MRYKRYLSEVVLTIVVSTIGLCHSAAHGLEVENEILALEDGKQYLKQEFVLEASVEDVWNAYTTSTGATLWLAPVAEVDFRLGGTIRTQYDPKAEIGDPGTVTLNVINYVPHRLITLQAELNEQWPGELREGAEHLYNVVEFHELGAKRTRIVSWGIGYGATETWDRMLRFFIKGNQWHLDLLERGLAGNPVNWSEARVPGT